VLPDQNPFRGMELSYSRRKREAATRSQAYALHDALIADGEPYLAVVPLVCFELLQRPENVLAGHLKWSDFQPDADPPFIRVFHHKTNEVVEWPLRADSDPETGALGPELLPELTAYLRQLTPIGIPVVLFQPKTRAKRSNPKPYPRLFDMHYARAKVRKAARAAKLPNWLTLDACRHGGMTELADAGLTEEQEMSLSGHKSPQAKRRYVQRTRTQRQAGLAKRISHRENAKLRIIPSATTDATREQTNSHSKNDFRSDLKK
jgi:hypothetical protein